MVKNAMLVVVFILMLFSALPFSNLITVGSVPIVVDYINFSKPLEESLLSVYFMPHVSTTTDFSPFVMLSSAVRLQSIVNTYYPDYTSLVYSASNEYNLNPQILIGIIKCESGGNLYAINKYSGAYGLAQFMPSTYNGIWNVYKGQYPINTAYGQIYSMALKIHEGDIRAWTCASILGYD